MPGKVPLLIVDDEPVTIAYLEKSLHAAGFETYSACRASEALELIKVRAPAIALLDMTLPDLGGIELCRRIKASSDVAVVMLSGRAETEAKVGALGAGADDYVTKPCDMKELVARLHAVLRRARPHRARVLSVGALAIDCARQSATLNGEALTLTDSEMRLLCALMEAPGRIFTRHELASHLYPGGGVVVDRAIDVHIARLRQKLKDDPRKPAYIHTIRSTGYALATEDELRRESGGLAL